MELKLIAEIEVRVRMEYEVEVDGIKHRVRFIEREGKLFVAYEDGEFPVRTDTPLRNKIQSAQVNGEPIRFGAHRGKETIDVVLDGAVYNANVTELEHVKYAALARRKGLGGNIDVKAPMPGMVIAIHVKPGQLVKKNESLLSLHAMKLENDIRSPREGVVKEIAVKPEQVLEKGALMIRLGPPPTEEE